MYACSPQWDADWISEVNIKKFLSQLSGRIKLSPHGPENVDLNSGLHFTGGEPFMNLELLLKGVRIARKLGLPSVFAETNCCWCDNDEGTEAKLRQLRAAGLNGTMLSVNPFVVEHVPFSKTERAVRISKQVFGGNAMVYQAFFHRQFRKLGIDATLFFEHYIERTGLGYLRHAETIPMGRLPYKLGHLFRKHQAEFFFGQSCQTRLTSPYHVHIDNYGNYIGGFCAGITLGEAHELDLILEGSIWMDGRL